MVVDCTDGLGHEKLEDGENICLGYSIIKNTRVDRGRETRTCLAGLNSQARTGTGKTISAHHERKIGNPIG